jgi:glycolate oxidase iron-sulfur subunit
LKNVKTLRNLAGLERFDAIVVSCASCGLSLKREYSHVLGIDAASMPGPVMDISEFIVKKVGLEKLRALFEAAPGAMEARPRAGMAGGAEATKATEAPRELVVTYHDPCHLRRGQGIKDEPREVIGVLPGVKLVEMVEPDRCCGGAGLYSFTQYEMSKAIAAHKVRSIVETGAEVVLTSCASCIMQIEDSLRQAGCTHRVMHVIELVSGMLRGDAAKGTTGRPSCERAPASPLKVGAGSISCSKKL